MTNPILVTGGTGHLGRVLTARLRDEGREVRVLSRRPGTGYTGDLLTGAGLDAALDGAGVVVHCASTLGKKDVPAARTLLAAARRAGVPHLVYISIVGIDDFPFAYYRTKKAVEELIAESGIPYTTLRATQFHDLVGTVFSAQRWLPVMLVPAGMRLQPVGLPDVAARLTAIVQGEPAGRVPDLGGPEIKTVTELARMYLAATGSRRPVLPLRLPGKAFRAFREGRHLAPDHADGRMIFAEFLAERTGHAKS
ncbi:SDR family oxidoreductase [Amycolatopsis acidicola]|uniref:SDR family oxidoreductase n=1 Tax=Amycolatopsis acidicola TaxID=2596893 RepID=A0A5N0UZU2_9PSEU|nr:SDR family oxidoreductase [Amycolatopsis acidicola]KAA9158740.1 SDR family oxidoreductase [Amycolatopsis acidicola]